MTTKSCSLNLRSATSERSTSTSDSALRSDCKIRFPIAVFVVTKNVRAGLRTLAADAFLAGCAMAGAKALSSLRHGCGPAEAVPLLQNKILLTEPVQHSAWLKACPDSKHIQHCISHFLCGTTKVVPCYKAISTRRTAAPPPPPPQSPPPYQSALS